MVYFFLITSLLSLHDFHVSKTLIEQSRNGQSLEISLHLFIDDLELALEKEGHIQQFIGTQQEAADAETNLVAFLHKKLQIEINGATSAPTWIGKEISEDLSGLWCYLELPLTGSVESVKVTNAIFLNLFADQKNIVQVSLNDGRKGFFLLEHGHPSESL